MAARHGLSARRLDATGAAHCRLGQLGRLGTLCHSSCRRSARRTVRSRIGCTLGSARSRLRSANSSGVGEQSLPTGAKRTPWLTQVNVWHCPDSNIVMPRPICQPYNYRIHEHVQFSAAQIARSSLLPTGFTKRCVTLGDLVPPRPDTSHKRLDRRNCLAGSQHAHRNSLQVSRKGPCNHSF